MTLAFIDFRILDIVDILLTGTLIFTVYKMLRGTTAINIFLGIVSLFLMWQLFSVLEMELLTEILGAFISVGLVALIIIFQPEIRQFLFELGTPTSIKKYGKKFNILRPFFITKVSINIDAIIDAIRRMGKIRQGALIVITRKNELKELVATGEAMDAIVSTSLIESIFFKNSPLHDGAIVITNNRVVAAKCILPVSRQTLADSAGLRHRAAVGITEKSDCVAITVSEETGMFSLTTHGKIKYRISLSELHEALIEELQLNAED